MLKSKTRNFLAPFATWAVILAAICIANFSAEGGVLLALISSVACYLVFLRKIAPRQGAALRTIGFGVLVVVVMGVLSYFVISAYRWLSWNPIGAPSDRGLLALDLFPPHSEDLLALPSGNGKVAILRRSVPFLDVAGSTYYVFVRNDSEPSNGNNLAFRYSTTPIALDSRPRLKWIGSGTLRIIVGPREAYQVSRQRDTVRGVKIKYEIATPECRPIVHPWQRSYWGYGPC